ncbi:S8 family peptidase [Roseateles violae]|uniref:S8 family serine peptidase n=1 Tax=Roseateles violae TaxID=3058042 RepID=A0ABT8DS13_9BURK|nr:S8 family serine peptidase [Pelomonas sp. PFR6]MDN3919858.1 S8 family serine peptidase [Pelomonas sp. PFR6]
MKRRWLCVLGLLAAWACNASSQPPPGDELENGIATAAQRQLLVMLERPRPHYRPDGSYAGGYGSAQGRLARQGLAESLAREHGLELDGEWPMPLVGVDCVVMRLPPGRAAEEALQRLGRDGRVAWAQPMQLYRTQAGAIGHRDPLYPAQPAAQQWRLAELHRLATGRGVRIAVIDSGVEAGHPDLQGQLEASENFVDGRAPAGERHGTAVAGIIAARADNGLGIAGVAPEARLLALRACWQAAATSDTLCTSLSLAKALHRAIDQGVQIINMSLAGPEDRLLARLLDEALARRIAVVAAASAETGGPQRFPASHAGVLAISDAAARPGVLLAPGRDVPSAAAGGGWALFSGASFAAPHVAGLLALLQELGHGVERVSAGSAGSPWRSALVTDAGGRIDACASVQRRSPPGQPRLSCATAADLAPAE